MYNPAHFDQLSDLEKADVIAEHGTFVKSIENNSYLMDIYRLDNFYVEIYFHRNNSRFLGLKSLGCSQPIDSSINNYLY